MKKTIDLTNVYRLRRNLHQAMLEMRLDDALALTKELESAAEKACYEITELDHICVPTTWDAFLKVLEERNGTAPNTIPNRWLGESEVYGAEILRGVRSGSTEERFNNVLAQHYGLIKPQLGPDIDPITSNDELNSDHEILARRVKWIPGPTLTRAEIIQMLEKWRLEAVELGLGMCALKLMEEKETFERLGEPELSVESNDIIRACLMQMAEKRSQNVMGGHLKGVVQTGIPENEMPTNIHGKPADIIMDKLAIIPERPDFSIPSMGSYMTPTKPAPHNVRYETNQSAMDKINAEKDRTEAFINIVPQELAVRMINDLQHLCSISDDINYVTALCNEMRRLSLFANGEVKSLNDINFAWIYRK